MRAILTPCSRMQPETVEVRSWEEIKVGTEFSRFVVFWSGSSVCLAYLAASLVSRGLIGWGEYGTTIAVCSCTFLIFWALLFLLEYVSVLFEMDNGGYRGDEE